MHVLYGETLTIYNFIVLYNFIIVLILCDQNYDITKDPKKYCLPGETCWPLKPKWEELKNTLNGRLHPLYTSMYNDCIKQQKNAFGISRAANGVCMQYHDCSKEFCNVNARWNIPSYSVEAKEVKDIQAALEFANKYNIAVAVKTSGHSYSGSSNGNGTLLIWMQNYKKYDVISKNTSNTCGTKYNTTLKVGGGEVWADAYLAVKDKYHIVGGGGLTVSAAGGWLQGVGLSALSRLHGTGIDNVINFELILANGTEVFVDACHNKDLFWALRGGGGGTFGVVTSATYRLWPVQPIVVASMYILNPSLTLETTDRWLEKWVQLSPKLDRRWGGYWTLSTFTLYFLGSLKDAEETFLNDVYTWKNSLTHKEAVVFDIKTYDSYFDSRGRENASTDETGSPTFNIANRLIPKEWVENNPSKAKSMLKYLARIGFFTFNYVLGGAMEDVPEDATAVNPAMRRAIWQVNTFGERMIERLRKDVKDTGVGYNHASKDEPDWRNAFWGANLERLQEIKIKYDTENRFNCWHCIGYQGKESNSSIVYGSTVIIFLAVFMASNLLLI